MKRKEQSDESDDDDGDNGPSFAKRTGSRASRVEIIALLLKDYDRCKRLFGVSKLNKHQISKVLATQSDVVGQSTGDKLVNSIGVSLASALAKGLPLHWNESFEENGKILYQLQE